MNTRTVTVIFGVVFILVGLAGFVPNPIISARGLFSVNAVHNLVHILLGTGFIAGALKFPGRERLVLKAFGLGGFAVTALGFLTAGDRLLGLIHVNQADHWLHLVLAAVVFAAGFLLPDRESQSYSGTNAARIHH